MRIAIASDHTAVASKAALAEYVLNAGHDMIDLGTDGTASVDYPDDGQALGEAIAYGCVDLGIALCGSGTGIAIAANRNFHVRCAHVGEPLSARLARTHNDVNAIAMGARLVGEDMAKPCIDAFLSAEFEGGRHTARVAKLSMPSHFQGNPA